MLSAPLVFYASAGVLDLALAAGLLTKNFFHRANRAFAFVLCVRGLSQLFFALSGLVGTGAADDFWLRLIPYLVLARPFSVLFFVAVYPRQRRGIPAGSWAAVPFLAGVALAELWYVASGPPAVPFAPPFDFPSRLSEIVQLGAMVAFAWDATRARPGPLRSSTLMMSAAFGLTAAYAFVATFARPGYALTAVAGVLALAALGILLLRAALHGDAGLQRGSRVYLALLATAMLSAFLPSLLLGSGQGDVDLALGGVWRLAFPLAATYALARHQLFDIDLRVKQTIAGSTVVGVFLLAFVVVDQGSRPFVGDEFALALAASALALLLFALVPLRRLGRFMADAALPGVESQSSYLDGRKLDMYRAALEASLGPDAALRPGEEGTLRKLRAELGITDRDHAILSHALGGAASAGGADVEAGAILLGRYRVESLLGEGGHGKAYLAHDEVAGRLVVVKVLPASRRGDAMVREAQALAAVRHPNVATLLDVRKMPGNTFVVMEYAPGGSLRDRLRSGPLDPSTFARVALGALRGLERVHAAGIVHRDLKPSNILLTAEGEPLLADFGVAHVPGYETTVGPGNPVGTVQYMAPEQAVGRPCTPQTDLYGLAAALYEASTGSPFLAARVNESAFELQVRAAEGRAFPAWRGPPALGTWFERALQRDPPARFPSAAAMRESLEAALAKGSSAPGTPAEPA